MSRKKDTGKKPVGGRAILLGLAATVLVVVGHWTGMDRWLELGSLDARFRWLSTAPPADQIVHVDIDDRSLETFGRWPWPREQLAGVVQTLEECGARSVALDIIMPEPQKVRYEAAVTASGEHDLELPPAVVFDDLLLRQTIRGRENIFIPMHVIVHPPPATALESAILEHVLAHPQASQREVCAAIKGLPASTGTEDRGAEAVQAAYLRARGLSSMRRFGLDAQKVAGCPAIEGGIVPPLVLYAQAVRHTGFVTFDPDGDGTVRRIPLLAHTSGGTFPQFALSIAGEELARRQGQPCELSADERGVVLRIGQSVSVIPVDRQGYMIINWAQDAPGRHVPAGLVGDIWRRRESIAAQEQRRRDLVKELLGMAKDQLVQRTEELDKAYWDVAALCEEANSLRREGTRRLAESWAPLLVDPAAAPAPSEGNLAQSQARAEAEIDRLQELFLAELADGNHLDYFLGIAGGPATESQPATRSSETEKLDQKKARALAIIAQAEDLGLAICEDRAKVEGDLASLRARVEGKICLVGSTATGAADFVPTPMEKRMPGVRVHANIVNTILSGRFVRPAAGWADLAAILLCGLAVSAVTARRPVWQSGPIAGLLAAAYAAGASLLVFHVWDTWLAMVAPLVAMLLAFLVVTAYRQLTEERAKRHIRALLSHTLSPELVDRLTEDTSLLQPRRSQLTCFFSDLQGFTPLAERLGEQGTVTLLHRYFDRMTEIIRNRQGGYMNKFLGDGIFAFFGAPVFQEDHAARGVRAAVDYVAGVEALNEDLRREFEADVRLSCRIGIATGEAMVGDCGSTEKFDYTAIGDTVNLASRLEGANKSFGTYILVDDSTWQKAAADGIVARCLGRVLVVGKNEPVMVWNLLGWRKDLSPEAIEAADKFTRAVELVVHRDLATAAGLLEEYRRVFPGDKAAGVYLDLCGSTLSPSGDEWDGVLRLTQK